MLHTVEFGAEHGGTPLLIAHGLFGSARNWGVIAKRLADTRRVITVDMRNHGSSPFDPAHSYPDLADDLAEVIRATGGCADVLGHSMGGKAAMMLALAHPELLRKLIVADIAPVGYGHTQTPLIDAMETLDLSMITSRQDADAALTASVPEAGVRAFLLQSLDLRTGPKAWRLNHTALRTHMDAIIGFPETADQSFPGPTFFLSGAASDYLRPEHRPLIKSLFPAARFAKIPGAGHWLHADKPREFEAAVRVFLDV
ncbi:alpha/beta fold hydrolase [Halocynthiibacter namhaensis]|uniref:alpha/beta fold hydrolase n=1 Tax=Halocynthiibacter namhaensis TaxID=1290553 RepID=UPI0005795300|nr:alpha/beta fold hydrolase [Halocynthiibacter namhaensis]